MNSIITLLSDFGTRDPYVASVKGVILGINPRVVLVDITHEIDPHHVEQGAFVLANAFSCFPPKTIHVVVVDPGVGSLRKTILLVTKDYFFLGPDNGLLTLAARRGDVKQAYELVRPEFFRSTISHTFHGRDILAPVAGHLSRGMRPEAVGPELERWVELDVGRPTIQGTTLIGKIVHVDVYGNLISNIPEEKLRSFVGNSSFLILVRNLKIRGMKQGYWEAKGGQPLALIGGGGYLEISVREGNAEKMLKVKEGDTVKISTPS